MFITAYRKQLFCLLLGIITPATLSCAAAVPLEEQTTDTVIKGNVDANQIKPIAEVDTGNQQDPTPTEETITSIESSDVANPLQDLDRISLPISQSSQLFEDTLNLPSIYRYKRDSRQLTSRKSLHSNLEELLNMNRRRRATRHKRNAETKDILALLKLLSKAEYSGDEADNGFNFDNYQVGNSIYPIGSVLYDFDDDNDDDYYDNDLAKWNHYYPERQFPESIYRNLLSSAPMIDVDSLQEAILLNQLPYDQQVMIPYTGSNRYPLAHKRSLNRPFGNRWLSLYPGLRQKRTRKNHYFDGNEVDAKKSVGNGKWSSVIETGDGLDVGDEVNRIALLNMLIEQMKPDVESRNKRSAETKTINAM